MARPLDFPSKLPSSNRNRASIWSPSHAVRSPCMVLRNHVASSPQAGRAPGGGNRQSSLPVWQSTSDSTLGMVEENCVSLWADPSMQVRITFGLGFQGKRLVLTNSTPQVPHGEGYLFDKLDTIPSMVLQGAKDMWNLDSVRIARLNPWHSKSARTFTPLRGGKVFETRGSGAGEGRLPDLSQRQRKGLGARKQGLQ